jgi:hypothetical protein
LQLLQQPLHRPPLACFDDPFTTRPNTSDECLLLLVPPPVRNTREARGSVEWLVAGRRERERGECVGMQLGASEGGNSIQGEGGRGSAFGALCRVRLRPPCLWGRLLCGLSRPAVSILQRPPSNSQPLLLITTLPTFLFLLHYSTIPPLQYYSSLVYQLHSSSRAVFQIKVLNALQHIPLSKTTLQTATPNSQWRCHLQPSI